MQDGKPRSCAAGSIWRPRGTRRPENVCCGELLGAVGEDVSIQPMFWCDYGCHIRMGSHIEINHNCVILDCAPVTFGDHVLIGPNCGF